MQLRGNETTVITGGMQAKRSAEFKFAMNDRMFEIFSSSIYQNKIRAVVREISTNAVDAHIDAGKPDVPFSVTLPTSFESMFVVRDYGKGLNEDQVYDIFTVYFESTKTNDNSNIGGYGLGSKSPLAYVDAFQIRSFQNGKMKTYTCYKDGKTPKVDLILEMDTDEPDGLEISLSVEDKDIERFNREAAIVYSFFDVKPEGSEHLNFEDLEVFEQEFNIYTCTSKNTNFGSASILMGGVLYPLTHDMLEAFDNTLWAKVNKIRNSIVFKAEIGDYDVPPSRENIDNTEHNLETFKDKMVEIDKKYQTYLDWLKVTTTDLGLLDARKFIEAELKNSFPDSYNVMFNFISSNDDFKFEGTTFDRTIDEDGELVVSSHTQKYRLNEWGVYANRLVKFYSPRMRYIERWDQHVVKTYALMPHRRNNRFPMNNGDSSDEIVVITVSGSYSNLLKENYREVRKECKIQSNNLNIVNEDNEDTIELLKLLYGEDSVKLYKFTDVMKTVNPEALKKQATTRNARGEKEHELLINGHVSTMSINRAKEYDKEVLYYVDNFRGVVHAERSGLSYFVEYLKEHGFEVHQLSSNSSLKRTYEKTDNFVELESVADHYIDKLASLVLTLPVEVHVSYKEKYLLRELSEYGILEPCLFAVDLDTRRQYDKAERFVRTFVSGDKLYSFNEKQNDTIAQQERRVREVFTKFPLLNSVSTYDIPDLKEDLKIYVNAKKGGSENE